MVAANSSGSPDDRDSRSSSTRSTPTTTTAARNSSGSPDDRSSRSAPAATSSPRPATTTTAARNSSGSPDDRSPVSISVNTSRPANSSGSPDDRNTGPTTHIVQTVPISGRGPSSSYPVDANGRISIGNPMALNTYGQSIPVDPLTALMQEGQAHRNDAIAARTAAGVKPSSGAVDWNGLMHDLNAPTRERGVKFDGGVDWGGIAGALGGAASTQAPRLDLTVHSRPQVGTSNGGMVQHSTPYNTAPVVDPESGMVQDPQTGTYYPAYQLQAIQQARAMAASGSLSGQGLGAGLSAASGASLPPIRSASASGLAAAMPVNNATPLNYTKLTADNAPERDLAATGSPVYPGLEGMVPGAGPAVVNQPQAKPSVWDNVVDGAGKVLSHTAVGAAMSNLFPDTWYGMGEAMKGHGGGTLSAADMAPNSISHDTSGNSGSGTAHDGGVWYGGLASFADLNKNGIDDALEGYIPPIVDAPLPTTPQRVLTMPNVSFPALPPYRPGIDPEYRYFTGPGYAEGGLVSAAPQQALSPMSGMDPRVTLIADAEDALEGHSVNPQQAIQAFVKAFGKEALQQLAAQVKGGMSLRRGGQPRMVTGPGGPKDDAVPAMIDGVQPAALSSGEMVMPVEAVAGAGNGDPRAGADRLMALSKQLSQRA